MSLPENLSYEEYTEYEKLYGLILPGNSFIRTMRKFLFEPFKASYKDLVNTVKPYKGKRQKKRDYGQVVYGIGNLFLSAAFLILAGLLIALSPFAAIYAICRAIHNLSYDVNLRADRNERLADDVLRYIRVIFTSPIAGIVYAIRGITQVAFFLPTLLFKMPARAAFTAYKGTPLIEDGASFQRLLTEGKEKEYNAENELSLWVIIKLLHKKTRKGLYEEEQPTQIAWEQELDAYSRVKIRMALATNSGIKKVQLDIEPTRFSDVKESLDYNNDALISCGEKFYYADFEEKKLFIIPKKPENEEERIQLTKSAVSKYFNLFPEKVIPVNSQTTSNVGIINCKS